MQSCKVSRCRFPNSHVTFGHVCGTCGMLGHGQMECRNEEKKRSLRERFSDDIITDSNLFCMVDGCPLYDLHCTSSHKCGHCSVQGGGGCSFCRRRMSPPTPQIVEKTCPVCKKGGLVDLSFQVYTGGECCVCFTYGPCPVFLSCKHALVCKDCILKW